MDDIKKPVAEKTVAAHDTTAMSLESNPDFPWLTQALRMSVEDGKADAASAAAVLQLARNLKSLTTDDVQLILRDIILPAFSTHLAFTGIQIEYRGVISGEDGRNIFEGTPFGAVIEKREFERQREVASCNVMEFAQWCRLALLTFAHTPKVYAALKDRWVGEKGYVWIDGDCAVASLYLPLHVADEFDDGLMMVVECGSDTFQTRSLDKVDSAGMLSAISRRFAVPSDAVNIFWHSREDCLEKEFSGIVAVNDIQNAALHGLARVKDLIQNILAICRENDWTNKEVDHDIDVWPIYNAMTPIKYGVDYRSLEVMYNRVNFVFDKGKLAAIQFGSIIVGDRDVPGIILCNSTIDGLNDGEELSSSDLSDNYQYKPRTDIKPLPLSDLVDLPKFGYGKQDELAGMLFSVINDLLLPKTVAILEELLRLYALGPKYKEPKAVIPEDERLRIEEENRREYRHHCLVSDYYEQQKRQAEKLQAARRQSLRPQVY